MESLVVGFVGFCKLCSGVGRLFLLIKFYGNVVLLFVYILFLAVVSGGDGTLWFFIEEVCLFVV